MNENKKFSFKEFFYRDVKEFNSIFLSFFCIGFLVLIGVFSYFIINSYALFSDEIESENVIGLSVTSCKNNPNSPVLSESMIPVYYDVEAEIWRKADSTNLSVQHKWYDYCEKMWANSVTVSVNSDGIRTDLIEAPEGTEIPMDRILTMQVWIPRYKYTVWNYNSDGTVTSQPQEIDINFERGIVTSGEIECADLVNMGTSNGTSSGTETMTSEICKLKSSNQICTDSICNGKTYTHPAFTFGDKELTGFWVGKFELGSDVVCTPANFSQIDSGCNLRTINPIVKPNVSSWRSAMVGTYENNIMAMNNNNNRYGFKATDDTHMIKNIEWGAIAYLSHSNYGTCTNGQCNEVKLNNYIGYKTGCGSMVGGDESETVCNAYNTIFGMDASTTGNIYGVYDMSGGAYEYIMGNIVSPDGITMLSGFRGSNSLYSGYTGIVYYGNSEGDFIKYTGTYEYPEVKYYDKYSFSSNKEGISRSKLGDGIKEIYYEGKVGWYRDYSYLPFSENTWQLRGDNYNHSVNSGLFAAATNDGDSFIDASSRLVISE